MELATGFSFALIFWQIFGLWDLNIWWQNITWILGAQLLIWWIFAAFLIIIFVYDLRYYLILDKVSLPAIILAFIANLFLGHSWLNLLIAALLAGGFFLAQFVFSQGKWIGGGDIRLGLLMGMMLGWPHILTGLFLAYVLGAIVGLFLIAIGKKTLSSKVPFGTFLTLAILVTLLYGDILLHWYLNLWR
jgi:prepilin signal peptidase PulO-like enzyme (type II secretory pathway)